MANVNLRLSFGALFIGCVMAVFLAGIGNLQAYQYFRKYRFKDSQFIRLMVVGVSCLDLLHTILVCHSMWNYLILKWGNLEELDRLIWPIAATVAVTGVVTITVQMFYAYRVWRFSRHNSVIVVPIVVIAIVRLGSSIATTVKMVQAGHFSTFLDNFRWIFIFGLALSCAVEVSLTSALCYYLQVNRAGQSTMDEIIHRLLMYTVSNGVLTTIGTLLSMLFIVVLPDSFLFMALHFIIAKCYVNSLLATLNSREALKKRYDSTPVAYGISVDGHSQPYFRRFTATDRRPPASSDQPIVLSDADRFRPSRSQSTKAIKVQVQVEQEVQTKLDRGSSRDRSIKSPSLSPSEEETHATLNLPRGMR